MSGLSIHDLSLEGVDGVQDVEALCLFLTEDDRPLKGLAGFLDWRMCGQLSRTVRQGVFKGTKDERLLFPSNGRIPMPKIFALGIGSSKDLSAEELGKRLEDAGRTLTRARVDSVAVEIPGSGTLEDGVRANLLLKHFLSEFKGSHVAVLSEKSVARLLPQPSTKI